MVINWLSFKIKFNNFIFCSLSEIPAVKEKQTNVSIVNPTDIVTEIPIYEKTHLYVGQEEGQWPATATQIP